MGPDKKHKKGKRKRKRGHTSDSPGGLTDNEDERQQSKADVQASRKKHKKKSHKEKKAKKSKDGGKHSPVPEEVLTSVGLLTEDDYFEKHAEFATWLLEKQGKYFNDLPSKDTRAFFSEFVEAWNSRALSMKYYEGISTAPSKRTQHKWGFSKTDRDAEGRRDATFHDFSGEGKQREARLHGFGKSSHQRERSPDTSQHIAFKQSERGPIPPERPVPGPQALPGVADGDCQQDEGNLSHLKALLDSSAGPMRIRKRS